MERGTLNISEAKVEWDKGESIKHYYMPGNPRERVPAKLWVTIPAPDMPQGPVCFECAAKVRDWYGWKKFSEARVQQVQKEIRTGDLPLWAILPRGERTPRKAFWVVTEGSKAIYASDSYTDACAVKEIMIRSMFVEELEKMYPYLQNLKKKKRREAEDEIRDTVRHREIYDIHMAVKDGHGKPVLMDNGMPVGADLLQQLRSDMTAHCECKDDLTSLPADAAVRLILNNCGSWRASTALGGKRRPGQPQSFWVLLNASRRPDGTNAPALAFGPSIRLNLEIASASSIKDTATHLADLADSLRLTTDLIGKTERENGIFPEWFSDRIAMDHDHEKEDYMYVCLDVKSLGASDPYAYRETLRISAGLRDAGIRLTASWPSAPAAKDPRMVSAEAVETLLHAAANHLSRAVRALRAAEKCRADA